LASNRLSISLRVTGYQSPSLMKKALKNRLSSQVKDPGRRLILRHLWRQRVPFVLTVTFTFLSALFEGVGLGLLIPFIESLTSPDAEPFRSGIAWIDQYILRTDADTATRLYWVSGLILGSIFLRGILSYLSSLAKRHLTENITASLRREIIDQVQAVSLRFFSKIRTGDILNTLTSEVSRINGLFGTSHSILTMGSMAMIYATAIFALSWPLALIALVLCGLLFLIMNRFLDHLRRLGRLIPKANSQVTSIATELINGIRTVIISGTQEYEADRFREATEEVRDLSIDLGKKTDMIGPISNVVSSTALIGIVIIAVQYFVLPGLMSAAMLLTFLFALFRLLPLVQTLNGLRGQWAWQRGSLENVADFISDDNKPYLPNGTRELDTFVHSIELENMGFAYHPDEMVLKDINMTIPRGETVAFVGATGAGKSTLADVIARLYDPTEGRILLDGFDLREYRIQSLRDKITVVSQDTFLFNKSVSYNLAYGIDHVSDEQLRWAAEQANALGFINELEDGFDTQLGDRGTRLSGGQRQRIAIARALLRDPEILILDEATSALDSITERLVQEALERLMRNRTVIAIAHRLSTIEHADKVVVLEEGEIVERGSYDELLARRGRLWEYHSVQYQAA
jgi:subfamily B ATP-binding cassette protein MsbA